MSFTVSRRVKQFSPLLTGGKHWYAAACRQQERQQARSKSYRRGSSSIAQPAAGCQRWSAAGCRCRRRLGAVAGGRRSSGRRRWPPASDCSDGRLLAAPAGSQQIWSLRKLQNRPQSPPAAGGQSGLRPAVAAGGGWQPVAAVRCWWWLRSAVGGCRGRRRLCGLRRPLSAAGACQAAASVGGGRWPPQRDWHCPLQ